MVFYLLAVYATLRATVGTVTSVDIIRMFEGIGITLTAAATFSALIGPSQIAGRVLEIFFGKNFNPVNSSLFWTAVLPLSIFLLILAGPRVASVFAIAYGMSNGVLTITMSILPMALFGARGYAKMLGKLALPVLISQAISPLLVAPLIERWPSINIFILSGIIGIFSLVSLLILAVISKRK